MRPRIFLDMDGVLMDFVTHACRFHNSAYTDKTWPIGKYDMVEVLGVKQSEFWKTLDRKDFWADMPIYAHAHHLVDVCLGTGYPVAILSSPARGMCAEYKRQSVRKHFPKLPLILATDKTPVCSGVSTLLIDDHEKNTDAWESCGGVAHLFPQRWNRAIAQPADGIPFTQKAIFDWLALVDK